VAVIAGTGSVVIALDVEEDEWGGVKQVGRRGGLGYLLGDEGSGEYDEGEECREGSTNQGIWRECEGGGYQGIPRGFQGARGETSIGEERRMGSETRPRREARSRH
jgi:hypothetical protein